MRKIINFILSAYKYLFVRIYIWQLKKFGAVNAPEYAAAYGVACLFLLNCYTLIPLFRLLTGINVNLIIRKPWAALIVWVIVSELIRFSFTKQERYKKYAMEYDKETSDQRRKRSVYVWIYTIGTVGMFFLSVISLRIPTIF